MAKRTFKIELSPIHQAKGKVRNQKRGKTPEEVAAIANIETKQVYRVINAEHSATISVTYAIAKGLGVHHMKLFDFDFKD